ncbi:MAG: hypothetical protein ACRDO9_05565, partial [Gaiellales bacterium]
ALTPVLGGGADEAIAAALVGLVVGTIAVAARRTVGAEPMTAPIAAVGASFSATVLAQLIWSETCQVRTAPEARSRWAFFVGGESAPAVVDALSRLIYAGRDRMTGCAIGSGAAL